MRNRMFLRLFLIRIAALGFVGGFSAYSSESAIGRVERLENVGLHYQDTGNGNKDTGGGNAGGSTTTGANAKASKKSTSTTASNSELASAKSSGKVWVNTESGVYHKGGRWYGKTKKGKFMTEDEAKAAGYKAAQKD